jgi:hypothetical protein
MRRSPPPASSRQLKQHETRTERSFSGAWLLALRRSGLRSDTETKGSGHRAGKARSIPTRPTVAAVNGPACRLRGGQRFALLGDRSGWGANGRRSTDDIPQTALVPLDGSAHATAAIPVARGFADAPLSLLFDVSHNTCKGRAARGRWTGAPALRAPKGGHAGLRPRPPDPARGDETPGASRC